MEKDTLEVTVLGMSLKANGTVAMMILAVLLLLVSTLAMFVAGPQLVTAVASRLG
ncbi:hypothetical protein C8J35_11518 [Rhizobium sp. PP-F2F-G38]|uniref:hypothetical protein n=1 Tax=Rhizobium sp. PP-CC-3G-465 TaxID=2135648 RepID=UPI000D912C23|nr:hypothetical protein C8J37_12721 [Rhizobium sp. PP-WC-1G-195]PYE93249.1 hypothetical protein C8J35_11518 [Rhizobium sp. PP-F2F-G38]TCP75070.1 hypothetical protein C8J31_13417 [Rhizobium sp. PP-CC-2G-626]TCQ16172.1 hypothetical protein C8J33_1175 [Rhizobium sp. PP-CC-3G-465]